MTGVKGSPELDPKADMDAEPDPEPADLPLCASHSDLAEDVVRLSGRGSPCMIASHFCITGYLLPGIGTLPFSVCGRSSHSCTSVAIIRAVATR